MTNGFDGRIRVGVGGIGFESAREIARCAFPWFDHCDVQIWVDGKFDFFPAENDYSEDGWLDIIEKECKKRGTEFVGAQYAGRQINKRQKYLDIAGKEKCDYFIVIDTEEYIDPNWQNWQRFWLTLINLTKWTKDRMFQQWIYIPDEKLWPKQGNLFPDNTWMRSAKIHYNPGTMRFCLESHFMWCPKDITDEKLIEWQMKHRDVLNPYQFHPRNVIDGVRIKQDRLLRTKEWNEKQEEWAFVNGHAENSRSFYKIMKARGNPAPDGYTWDEWENKPHTFDRKTGQRIEL
jgi:hypothetical protein